MMRPPLILLTNDDGVHAPGLAALCRAVQALGRVEIVAPPDQRSAASHAVSVLKDMAYEQVPFERVLSAHVLHGTPADCVKLAFSGILGELPDLVVSGINPGANIGNNILYSGTVAAAREGAMLGVAAIAVSLDARHDDSGAHFETAARFTARLIPDVLRRGLPRGALLNVNVPNLPEAEVGGVVVSRQSGYLFRDVMEPAAREGRITAWRNVGVESEGSAHGEDFDDVVLRAGKISVTPLHYDMTHHAFRAELRRWIEGAL